MHPDHIITCDSDSVRTASSNDKHIVATLRQHSKYWYLSQTNSFENETQSQVINWRISNCEHQKRWLCV